MYVDMKYSSSQQSITILLDNMLLCGKHERTSFVRYHAKFITITQSSYSLHQRKVDDYENYLNLLCFT